jgi:hypothetical protein
MRRALVATALFGAVVAAGCGGRRATREDCRQVLDRLVELELREKGFRDAALVARWRANAETAHVADLAACEGRRMARAAMTCVAAATSSEEIVHRCFQ